jgi:ABC-2 type transport system permease protein
MDQFKGTVRLVRLALRRDRVKLPVSLVVIGSLMPLFVIALNELINDGTMALQQIVSLMAANPATRLFGLPTGGEPGDFMMLRTFLFTVIIIALISTFTVIRHTRQNEEMGRSELIGANVVGRHAALAAALIVTVGFNMLVILLAYLGLMTGDFPAEGAWAMSIAIGMTGIIFAGIAAVCAQLTKTSRGANGLASASAGIAFMIAGISSVLGQLHPNGLEVNPLWTVWLSPFGWGQLMYPFAGENWWMLAVFAAFFGLCIGFALFLASKRDVGSGIFEARPGRATAKQNLLTPFGLIWRLNKGVFLSWLVGITLLGAVYGTVASSVEELLTQAEGMEELFMMATGSDELILAFFGAVMGILGIFALAYAVQVTLRLRAEENRALEFLLSTSIDRIKWVIANIVFVGLSVMIILLMAGLSAGFMAEMMLDNGVSLFWPTILGALVQLPAIILLAGLVVAIFGLIPRFSHALAWTAVSISLAFSPFFSSLFNVPDWLISISPLSHTPIVPPTDSIEFTPLLVLSGIAVLLITAGSLAFRSRDITTT